MRRRLDNGVGLKYCHGFGQRPYEQGRDLECERHDGLVMVSRLMEGFSCAIELRLATHRDAIWFNVI